MLRIVVLLIGLVLSKGVLAQTACGEYFDRHPPEHVLYAIAFANDLDAQAVRKLENHVSPLLHGLARGLLGSSASPPLRIKLFVCKGSVGDDDLEQLQVKSFVNARVVAFYWRALVGEQQSLVQLAIPIFLKPEMQGVNRDEVEIAASIPGGPSESLQTWTQAFSPASPAYRASVYMGLAEQLRSRGMHATAWSALCLSHGVILSSGSQIVRPSRDEIKTRFASHVVDLMATVRNAMPPAERVALPPCPGVPVR